MYREPPLSKDEKIITYVPQEEIHRSHHQEVEELGRLRRGVHFYTHQLGQNFTLVLLLSFFYQGFVAIFIALRGLKTLPIFAQLPQELLPQLIGNSAALLFGVIVQGLLIAELAQVVWLRQPDKLKVRLMRDSLWWWVMLAALLVTGLIDFFLLFLSVTGQEDLGKAWQLAQQKQMDFFINLLLTVLNFLTLLRCAATMRTTTSAEIREEVEERLKAIAEEILIDAGDSARQKATQVWKQLSVNPQRFVPIHESVLRLISEQHPELVPPKLGGNSWAYDFNSNTLAFLPSDLHQALLQSRQHMKGNQNEQADLWKLHPQELAEVIGYNLATYGQPRFVDATEPEAPRYLNRPAEFSVLTGKTRNGGSGSRNGGSSSRRGRSSESGNGYDLGVRTARMQRPLPSRRGRPALNPPPGSTSYDSAYGYEQEEDEEEWEEEDGTQQFLSELEPRDQVLFANYLANIVFPKLYQGQFTPLPEVTIFDVFDEVELRWYFREWKQGTVATPKTRPKRGSN